MDDEKSPFVWIFDRTIFDQIELPRFEWYELILLAGALAFLVGYFLSVWYLERRSARRAREARELADVRRRLEPAELTDEQWQVLHRLAGTRSRTRLLHFLADPVAFETAVFRAFRSGQGGELGFVTELREHLGYGSRNALVPLVSTRQLRPGDHVRVTTKGAGLPRHHYGTVEAVGAAGFSVRLGDRGVAPGEIATGEQELYFVRGHDLEHRFPFVLLGPLRDAHRLDLRHVLVSADAPARQIRLPLLADVRYAVRVPHGRAADRLDPDLVDTEAEPGVLYDLSDSGFALVTSRPVPEGRYLELTVPLRRKGRSLALMGRVTACRKLGNDQWMAHAAIRGLSRAQRHTLHQVVIHEQNRRFKTLARIQQGTSKAS